MEPSWNPRGTLVEDLRWQGTKGKISRFRELELSRVNQLWGIQGKILCWFRFVFVFFER